MLNVTAKSPLQLASSASDLGQPRVTSWTSPEPRSSDFEGRPRYLCSAMLSKRIQLQIDRPLDWIEEAADARNWSEVRAGMRSARATLRPKMSALVPSQLSFRAVTDSSLRSGPALPKEASDKGSTALPPIQVGGALAVPRRGLGLAVAAVALLVAACSSGAADGNRAPTTATVGIIPSTSTVGPPEGCDDVTPLFSVEVVLDGAGGTCRQWVDRSFGRAVRGSTGSASIWSRRSEHGTALVLGAVHSLGLGWLGPADTAVMESIVNPEDQIGVPRLFLILPDGSGPDPLASPWFGLYNPTIAAGRNNNYLQDLLPREDFYIAVTDSQKLDVSKFAPAVEPIVREDVPLYDPAAVTTTIPTWADAVGGDLLLLLGYANETGALSASVGRVRNHDEATRAVAILAALGDPEGSIPYDAEAEMIVEGEAVAGMSGGPAVDEEGRLVGILVRATDVHDGVQYVRVVRMSYVVSRLAAALEGLDFRAQQAMEGFLEPAD